MRTVAVVAALLCLAACGDAPSSLEEAKQGALEIGQQAVEAAAGAVDTRTACTLAGQSEAFCGCLQERLGPEIKPEHIDAVTTVIRRTLEGQGVEAAAEGAQGIDQPTRDALVQCAASTAVTEAAN